jgi:hypothetical protein
MSVVPRKPTVFRDGHHANASSPMDLTLMEMNISVKALPANAPLPMEVMLRGMFTPVRLVQLPNVSFPMDVTVSGILTDFKLVQKTNVPFPMDVTPLGMVTEVKLVQYWNKPPPMAITGYIAYVIG